MFAMFGHSHSVSVHVKDIGTLVGSTIGMIAATFWGFLANTTYVAIGGVGVLVASGFAFTITMIRLNVANKRDDQFIETILKERDFYRDKYLEKEGLIEGPHETPHFGEDG